MNYNQTINTAFNFFTQFRVNENAKKHTICATMLMAEQFATVTIQQNGENVILATQHNLISFEQNKDKIINRYNKNSLLYYKLKDTIKLRNKSFTTNKVELSNLSNTDVCELYRNLQNSGYISLNNNKTYTNIIVITSYISELNNTDNKKYKFTIAIPIISVPLAAEISSELEFQSISEWIQNLNPAIWHMFSCNEQKQKLVKLENLYNQILYLEKNVLKHGDCYLTQKQIVSTHSDIQCLRQEIEKKYFQIYSPQIEYLKILELVINN